MPPRPPTPPASRDVHVWQWDLDADEGSLDRNWEILSEEERVRADKFRFERHRRRFVAARGRLRQILADYLAMSPQAVGFGYGDEGKPFCTTQPSGWRICFNLSHSDNRAALAVANDFEIGIDIEHVRTIEDGVALQVFSPAERTQFDALPPGERQSVFFENWARKEACLKALGTGFAHPPTHFEFDLAIGGDTAPRFVGGDAEEAKCWRIRALRSAMNRTGSVAARRLDWSIVEMN
ncbi:4'-phosphopantetheinyl transferase superfamily protein [Labrys sp. LIt4]|uniref:4'-phosphopantetheinyl transferase family protein n=1 Tax=Labrys sp. LIt4 TaxID=2821355 RepID=UPI001AE05CB2|nr:4'-phosphopantetheinyl transferase superfamily protein [Labrys sp. LIt4]MBP0579059.1 4'-phosphopantetheinyl transferase superfamily protein [Labrys sp. LIt4]